MHIAVTGGSGQLGTVLLRRLAANRSIKRITTIDIKAPLVCGPKINAVNADVRDPGIGRHFEGVEGLFHLAFLVTQMASRDEMHSVNVEGSKNVFQAAAAQRIPSIVYASSTAAYGVVPGLPPMISEDTPRVYQEEFGYSATKYLVEEFLDSFEAQVPDIAISRLRPGILAGARMDHTLGKALAARMVVDVGNPPLSWVWDEDVAEAAILAFRQKARGAFNLVASDPLSSEQFAKEAGFRYVKASRSVIRALNSIPSQITKMPKADPVWINMNIPMLSYSSDKATRVLGWKPRFPSTQDVAKRLGQTVPGMMDPRLMVFFRLAALGAKQAPASPELAHLNARIHLDITGPGGGDVAILINNSKVSIVSGDPPRPPTTVLMLPAPLLMELLSGQTSLATAQLTGKIRIEGEPIASMALSGIIEMFRKQAEDPSAKAWPARALAQWMKQGSSA